MLEILKQAKTDQEKNEAYYADLYCHNYEMANHQITDIPTPDASEIHLVNVQENGHYIQPRVNMHASSVIHHELMIKNYNFHSLRHTHATMLAEKGALPKDIQNRLGHKNIEVTMEIYVQLTKSMEDISIQILDDIPLPTLPSE